ncbi:diguanylate cyclase [bacterium]|nr:diguanylate cyclase [bacterium]
MEEGKITTGRSGVQQLSVEAYQRLAFTDELTGLRNNRFLKYRAPAYINAARKTRTVFCLAMMDMDGFKRVNDTYGHKAGDTLLANFGKLISEYIGKHGVPIRYAGDEFAALLHNIDKASAKRFFDGFLRKLNETPIDIGDGVNLLIKISVGIASYPNDAEDYESLFKRSDEALYAAKESGKGMVITYPDEGKLVAPGNISTLFPVEEMVGFDKVFAELKLHTIDRPVGDKTIQEIAFVCGDRGSGKTRLLQELRKSAENRGISTIFVTGAPAKESPYLLLIKAVADLLNQDQELLKEITLNLTSYERKELEPSIPSLESLPPAAIKGDKEPRDTLVFKALNKILFTLLRKGRVLVILDDAHLIDLPSLQFLDTFVSEISKNKIDIAVGIITQAEGGAESNLANFIRAIPKISQSAEVYKLELPRLGELAIAGIIYQITGHIKIPPGALNALHERTEGNPLFVEEQLKLAIERGLIEYDGTNWKVDNFTEDDLPKSIEDIAEERAANLPQNDKDVLSKAAVIGENFDVKVLARLIGREEQEVQDTLEAARRAHIVQEDLTGESDYAFHSDASRNAFYKLISPEERKEIHYKVAEVEKELNKDHLDDIMGELAYHFQEAERWDKAVEVLSATGDRQLQAQIPDAVRRMLHRRLYVNDMVSKKQLAPDDLQKAFLALKDLRIAIQSYRFYPPQNQNVRKTINKSFQEISYILTKVPLMSLSMTPDSLLINAQEPQTDSKDQHLVSEYRKLLSRYNLNGVIFMEGMTIEELTGFISIFKMPREEVIEHWNEVIEKKGLKNIKPDQTVYVAVGAQSSQLEGKAVRLNATPSDEEQAEIAKEIVAKVGELVGQFRSESKDLLKTLQTGKIDNKSAEELIDTLKELSEFIPGGAQPQFNIPADFLKKQAKLASESSQQQTAASGYAGGQGQMVSPQEMINNWIVSIDADDKVEKAKAVQNLIKNGEKSIEACITGIMDESDLKARRLMAVILNRIGEKAVKTYSRTLARDLSPGDIIALLSVAEFFKNDVGVQRRLADLVFSPFEEIRSVAIEKLRDFPVKLRMSVLEKALQSSENTIMVEAVRQIGRLGVSDKIPQLISLIDKKAIVSKLPDTSLAEAAIESLGELKASQAVDLLIKLSEPGGLFRRAMPDVIRIEAVKALGSIGGKRAEKAIKKLSKRRKDPVGIMAKGIIEGTTEGEA